MDKRLDLEQQHYFTAHFKSSVAAYPGTQKDLAAQLNVKPANISIWLNHAGKFPKQSVFNKLALIFDWQDLPITSLNQSYPHVDKIQSVSEPISILDLQAQLYDNMTIESTGTLSLKDIDLLKVKYLVENLTATQLDALMTDLESLVLLNRESQTGFVTDEMIEHSAPTEQNIYHEKLHTTFQAAGKLPSL